MKLISRHRPLGLVDQSVLTYLSGHLYLCDERLQPIRRLDRLPIAGAQRIVGKSALGRRLLRLEPTDAITVDAATVLVNSHGRVLRVDLGTGRVEVDFDVPLGRKAMRLRKIENVAGFTDGAMFGDYCPNPGKGELTLWHRPLGRNGSWTAAATIPAGTANHVHDLVPDPHRGCIWVLTGDFDQAPGLWRLTPDLKLTPILRGTQQDRAGTLFVTPEALFYATDTPLERNHLYRVDDAETDPVRTEIAELPGSVIYGEISENEFFFATAVEPGMPTGNRWRDWGSRSPGPGITSDRAHVFRLQSNGHLDELGSAAKDRWPMVLFQFGTFHICPSPGGGAFAFGVAVSGERGALALPSARLRRSL